MTLSSADRAEVRAAVRQELAIYLGPVVDRVDHLIRLVERGNKMGAEVRGLIVHEQESIDSMKQQTQDLLNSVADVSTTLTEFEAKYDAHLADLQAAQDSGDSDGIDQAIAGLRSIKSGLSDKITAMGSKADAVAVLTPSLPDSPAITSLGTASNATANPASADPNAKPFDASQVPGDSLGAQAVGAASSDGKPVDGHTVDDNPGQVPTPIGSPAVVDPASQGAAPAEEQGS
jgi:hypothetical protein